MSDKKLTPANLREIAEMLDVMDETIRFLIPFCPTTDEAKEQIMDFYSSDEMQQDIRRWADDWEGSII